MSKTTKVLLTLFAAFYIGIMLFAVASVIFKY